MTETVFNPTYANLQSLKSDQSWLSHYGQYSWKRFNEIGLPDRNWENWRFMNLRHLKEELASALELRNISNPLHLLKSSKTQSADGDDSRGLQEFSDLQDDLLSSFDAILIRGKGGVFDLPEEFPERVEFSRLAKHAESPFGEFDRLFPTNDGKINHRGWDSPFALLSNALMQDALFIRVKNTENQYKNPLLIHLVHQSVAHETTANFPRIFIHLDPGAQVCFIESYVSNGSQKSLCMPLTQCLLEKGSVLSHLRLHDEEELSSHVGGTQVIVKANARLHSLSISKMGKIVRQDLAIKLTQEGAHAEFNGLFLVKSGQVVDHHTAIHHLSPHTTSRQLYHGMIDGDGRGIFNGKILVSPGAEKTDARQVNKNLILSSEGEIHTKPELQIEADDVKCSHGAAIGQVDPNHLFYLKSRGIPEEEGRKMLLNAFAFDVLERFPIDSPKVLKWVSQKIAGHFS